ncbi:DegV family protein [Leptolinea tardivitalis]|uniref:DegV family EDD domain-containing protein n=1 Tax=Leptolinea tardivitalis TaxID=229920 RepID=A0A0P6WNK5_9CHLR|nr:DegV family protein [Leptolinea tardivitalis]KPL70396.1 DegV family EDD domain-containing protein [Leptolinea tardivitalis]GAP21966.1 protein containing EDD domain protein, DegV family [Leptolinea tardivitalis]
MSDYVITCCSTADLPLEYMNKRHIPYVCFHFTMNGKEYPDDLGQTIPFDTFYAEIAAGALPTTSQVNVNQFIDFFEPFLKQEKDILHISLSSGLSGSFNSAVLASKQLQQKYPNRNIKIIDSLGASSGYGLLVDSAKDRQETGSSLEDVYNWVEENKLRIHHWFFSTDLTHYKRGGRISATSAIVGGLLNICPLMNMDNLGRLIPREKIRGKKRVIQEIVQKMEEHAQNGLDYSGKCFISNSACFEDARMVADLVEARFPHLNGKVMINSVGTVIGAHTGPGTVALFFFGDERVN